MKFSVWPLILIMSVACAHKVRREGGQIDFDLQTAKALTPQERVTLAHSVVVREERDPFGATLKELRQSKQWGFQRVGTLVFETLLQPSYSGLAADRNLYLSARGKQLLTEEFLKMWEEKFTRLENQVDYVPLQSMKDGKAFISSGIEVSDYVVIENGMQSEDAFYADKGKKIPMVNLINPRHARDLSIVLVPATDMLIGPKTKPHQVHWINDMSKEFELDGVVVTGIRASWQRGGIDKRSKEVIPEQMEITVEASLLLPMTRYHELTRSIENIRDLPKSSATVASYSVQSKIPAPISQELNQEDPQKILDLLRTQVDGMLELIYLRMESDLIQ